MGKVRVYATHQERALAARRRAKAALPKKPRVRWIYVLVLSHTNIQTFSSFPNAVGYAAKLFHGQEVRTTKIDDRTWSLYVGGVTISLYHKVVQ